MASKWKILKRTKVYFLTDASIHRRAMEALRQQVQDWTAIQQGLKERARGLGQPLSEVDVELRKEFGFPLAAC